MGPITETSLLIKQDYLSEQNMLEMSRQSKAESPGDFERR